MKERAPALVYFYSLFTREIYFIYWLLSLSEELNRFCKGEIIRYKFLLINYGISVVSTYFMIFLTVLTGKVSFSFLQLPYFVVILGLAIYSLVIIIGTVRKIGFEIAELEKELGYENPLDITLLTFLCFVFNTGMIYLQHHINKVIIAEEKRRVEAGEPEDAGKNSKIPLIYCLVFFVVMLGIYGINYIPFVQLYRILTL